MGTFRDYLDSIRHLVVDDEAAARYDAERAAWRDDQRRQAIALQVARLSPRHVAYVRTMEAGEHEPSDAWRALSRALQDEPGASRLLLGPTGIGKTTAAVRWAYRRAQAGETVLQVSAVRYPTLAKHEAALEEAEQVGLLILDQTHRLAEMPEWIATPIRELVDSRYERQRQTIACFTGEMAAALHALKHDIIERLGVPIVVTGRSYRRTW